MTFSPVGQDRIQMFDFLFFLDSSLFFFLPPAFLFFPLLPLPFPF